MTIRNTFPFFILLIVQLITSCSKKGKNNPEACNGDTRRPVKIMTDDLAWAVDTIPIFTTIDSLGSLEVSEVKSQTGRQEVEKRTYTVKCYVEKVKRVHDGDIHIKLQSGDKYMIVEAVNPDCDYAESSKLLHRFVKVREFLENNKIEGKTVYITGVAFIDIDHHYKRKQAENNLELHPVLDIHF
jgi:hypothetical protein